MKSLRLLALALPFFGALLSLSTMGCGTDAYCFADCGTTSASSTTSSTTGSGGGGVGGFNAGQGGSCSFDCTTMQTTTTGTSMCVKTNNGVEVCDGKDNDCNGKVDDVDPTGKDNCGGCPPKGVNCTESLLNNDPKSITCTNGKCKGTCLPDYYDLDGDGTCEYYCQKISNTDTTCDNRDDDCNGLIDDGVDTCSDVQNCGGCGRNCVIANGTPVCNHPAGMTKGCDATMAQCAILSCKPGFYDIDKSPSNGCEYACTPGTDPITHQPLTYDICGNGIDDDCDGQVDSADPDTQPPYTGPHDPILGTPCFGGDTADGKVHAQGVCAEAAHAGTWTCAPTGYVCSGPNVILPGTLKETCNGKDDDCDGTIDNNLTDAGGACPPGGKSTAPCRLGHNVCVQGKLQCQGAILPQPETCNGIDDDCDGTVDNNLPANEIGQCNQPTPPPPGFSSACQAGTLQCENDGILHCVGSITADPNAPDTCGFDANCDGIAQNQPDLTSDVHNCGTCGHDCTKGTPFVTWSCNNGMCQNDGCITDQWTVPGFPNCTYHCIFTSAQEVCNGKDDNCDGQIDEGVIAPSPTQVCGVSPSASAPECTTGVGVSCAAGKWSCTFPAGVCSGTAGCSTGTCCKDPGSATEVCEDQFGYTSPGTPGQIAPPGGGLDNDCNGLVNENVANWAQPCSSSPSDGACQTKGYYYCSSPTTVACGARKDITQITQEICDGIDNDCDGVIDETKDDDAAAGGNGNYVKPAVVNLGGTPGLWVMQYEASRPSATNVTAGNGNGYFCSADNTSDPFCTSAAFQSSLVPPTGTRLDKTLTCSAQHKIPWFNVNAVEAEQSCRRMGSGGHVCTEGEWQSACIANAPPNNVDCNWGYAPASGSAGCTLPGTGSKFCNINAYTGFGDANVLLPTADSSLQNCFADWSQSGSPCPGGGTSCQIFDMTGNVRELTGIALGSTYALLGGSFDTMDEQGATCTFDFYKVDTSFILYDVGFRCCFTSDPTQ